MQWTSNAIIIRLTHACSGFIGCIAQVWCQILLVAMLRCSANVVLLAISCTHTESLNRLHTFKGFELAASGGQVQGLCGPHEGGYLRSGGKVRGACVPL